MTLNRIWTFSLHWPCIALKWIFNTALNLGLIIFFYLVFGSDQANALDITYVSFNQLSMPIQVPHLLAVI